STAWLVRVDAARAGRLLGLIVLALKRPPAPPSPEAATHDAAPAFPDARWIAVCALVMFGLQAYIAGAVESWTVAGAFGQRRFVSVTPLLVLGLAALLAPGPRRTRWARWTAVAVVAACVWWNLGLMAQFGMHTMD